MSLEHILLGMLEQPASGYALKQDFDQGARHFWSAELSQIYPTLQRMHRRGWLASRRQPSDKGPPRRLYRRTAAGTRELKRWLATEPVMGSQRFAYIGQLAFMDQLGDPAAALRFVRQLRDRLEVFQQFLTTAEQGLCQGRSDPSGELDEQPFHEWLCLGLGLASLRAKVQWCERAAELIQRRIDQSQAAARLKSGKKKNRQELEHARDHSEHS